MMFLLISKNSQESIEALDKPERCDAPHGIDRAQSSPHANGNVLDMPVPGNRNQAQGYPDKCQLAEFDANVKKQQSQG